MSSFLAPYKFKVSCQLLHDPLSDSVAPDADGFHFKIRSTCQFFVISLRREIYVSIFCYKLKARGGAGKRTELFCSVY